MKEEVKIMKSFQKKLWDNQYPGYPFQTSIVIDLSEGANGVAWVDMGRKQKLNNALKDLFSSLTYQIVGCTKMRKRTWLQDQVLSDIETIKNCDYEDVYIDNHLVAKFYLMLNCAIYSHKKNNLQDHPYIFGCIDDDCEYAEVKVFKDLNEIKQYEQDYWAVE